MTDVRQLGKCVFELRCPDQALKNQLNSLFRPYTGKSLPELEIVQINHRDVRSIVNTALKFHEGCLWIDAAALISPGGKKVLIAGASHAGKSTTTVALAFKEKWKVFSEDIVLFDLNSDKLICFASPFSLKPGTFDRLSAQDCHTPVPVLNEWIPMNGLAAGGEVSANLDLVLFFEHIKNPSAPGPLTIAEMRSAEFVRRILPISNLLHDNQAVDKLSDYMADADCFSLSGGSISERLRKITELCAVP